MRQTTNLHDANRRSTKQFINIRINNDNSELKKHMGHMRVPNLFNGEENNERQYDSSCWHATISNIPRQSHANLAAVRCGVANPSHRVKLPLPQPDVQGKLDQTLYYCTLYMLQCHIREMCSLNRYLSCLFCLC